MCGGKKEEEKKNRDRSLEKKNKEWAFSAPRTLLKKEKEKNDKDNVCGGEKKNKQTNKRMTEKGDIT